ncbi:MAG: AmmeMemoRadiSam system protein A [Lachnospiraceae bacterium]|nr:AmmeMemoRadiSam system protein A [Lachnospiraceae bacterium]
MAIVGAFAVPHPPLIIPEVGRGKEKGIADTINSYEKVSEMIAEMKPETIVIITPHSVMYSDYFHISPGDSAMGSFAHFGAPEVGINAEYDTAFVKKLCVLCAENEVDAGVGGQKDPTLDHGTLIPLYFITKRYTDFNLVRIGISGLEPEEHYRLGMMIKRAAQELNRRVVCIASGDLSHKLTHDGPYGFCPDAAPYDNEVMNVLEKAEFGALMEFNELRLEKVAVCGHRAFIVMGGALDGVNVKAKRLSYEGPFGVGYGVVTFKPEEDSDIEGRHFLALRIKKENERRAKQREREDIIVRLARKTLETYIREGRIVDYEEELKSIVDDDKREEDLINLMKNSAAGAFVSLHKNGRLRGCIGTIMPTKERLAEEIVENAIAAGTRDPRFDPVTVGELDELDYSVDVLGDIEENISEGELDVDRYGVIVTKGFKRGLLLPRLETIDTVKEQISVAKKKAGIGENEEVNLSRFEVVRHK